MATKGPFLRRQRQDRTIILTLDRPPVNALSLDVLDELEQAMAACGRDTRTRAVIITGSGSRCFAAGADIGALPDLDPAGGLQVNARFQAAFDAVAACPLPVICAINGLALGGGLELALAADIRIAADHAGLGLPEANLGLVPGGGGTQRLPRLIPPSKAKELMWTCRRLNAAEALRLGLVDQVVAGDELLPAAVSMAAAIAQRGPMAVRAIKAAIDGGLQLSLAAGLQLERELAAGRFGSAEAHEGIQAFFAKRSPVFADPAASEDPA